MNSLVTRLRNPAYRHAGTATPILDEVKTITDMRDAAALIEMWVPVAPDPDAAQQQLLTRNDQAKRDGNFLDTMKNAGKMPVYDADLPSS